MAGCRPINVDLTLSRRTPLSTGLSLEFQLCVIVLEPHSFIYQKLLACGLVVALMLATFYTKLKPVRKELEVPRMALARVIANIIILVLSRPPSMLNVWIERRDK